MKETTMRMTDNNAFRDAATGANSLEGITNCLLFLAEEADANKETVLRDLLKAAAVYAKERSDSISPYSLSMTGDGR
ncbi:hypothetical protein [Oceanibaculum pacificum]|nr:hypothetical protein [Oceanibaculum pacificum]